MHNRLGIRGRLLLAFFALSAISMLSSAAAIYAHREVGSVVAHITQSRVPSALAALQLSRQVERVAAAAPSLLAATTKMKRADVSAAISTEMVRIEALLGSLKGSTLGTGSPAEIEGAVLGLEQNLRMLDDLVATRLTVVDRKQELLRRLGTTTTACLRLVNAGTLVANSKMAAWRKMVDGLRRIARAARRSDGERLAGDRGLSSPTESPTRDRRCQ